MTMYLEGFARAMQHEIERRAECRASTAAPAPTRAHGPARTVRAAVGRRLLVAGLQLLGEGAPARRAA